MAGTALAEREFIVNATPDRVWRLIGKVIFSVLPGMESMEILDENNFRSLLRVKMMGSEWVLKLKGEMVDISPPESFSVRLLLEGLGGLVKADQKVTLAMTPVEKGKTSVTCRATAEDMGFLQRAFLTRQARVFAQSTFEAIEKRLKELA
ncbi:MAG TPA: SRPBCC family protein [Thermodesulfobacteriota bacterium]|nr:SRPBCC family protein [Thermodesulfobacteriota bacterium]